MKKEVEKLERDIMKLEDKLEEDHKALEEASNRGDNSKIMELSSLIGADEEAVEVKFERLEVAQTQLDEILAEFEEKLAALEG